MKFIDLFAGLGGFHLALKRLGHTCVFACELDQSLAILYERNFGIKPAGDIRKVALEDIPEHDVLCAGFPCQPFSKAGDQQGFGCPRWGDLFDYVLRVIEFRKPGYLILENVPNLLRHDGGKTWAGVARKLGNAGYEIDAPRLSPHYFGVPQIRDRVFIIGSTKTLPSFAWPSRKPDASLSLKSVLDTHPPDARPLTAQVRRCLDVWQDFLDRFPADIRLPSFPIWSMEFGADYPYEETTPHALGPHNLAGYRGSHGFALQDSHTHDGPLCALPSYARTKEEKFPRWKIQFIRQNRSFYNSHKSWIDVWMPDILQFPPSLQKLEWNCQGGKRSIWDNVIQFRASGVRVKRPTTAPSLIAMTATQVPIIGWEGRYMTPRECARLQSLDGLEHLPEASTKAFGALGNAVNVHIVETIAAMLLAQLMITMPIKIISQPRLPEMLVSTGGLGTHPLDVRLK